MGYGDVVPVTPLGRMIGVATMLVGISTFAVITAKMAEFLVRSDLNRPQASADGESGNVAGK